MKLSDGVTLEQVLAANAEWAKDYWGPKGASLSDERRANLSRAYLSDANLSRANLSRANLSRANLSGANLSGAYLSDANLSGANLSRAYLSHAYLSDANLSDANLSRANLSGAYLSGANLSGANIRDANLSGAYLRGATIDDDAPVYDGVTLKEFREQIVPALCTAGGVDLETVAAAWDCHSWNNCPMHVAFNTDDLGGVPALWRSQAKTFIQLFDAGLLPKPETVNA